MDYSLNDDQQTLLAALQSILRDYSELPQSERVSFSYFNHELQTTLTESGFLDAGRDMGMLEAALVTIECARLLPVVEVGASSLVATQILPESRLEGPVALMTKQGLTKAQRNLSIAKSVIIDCDDEVVILAVKPEDVEVVSSVYGYPYGKFKQTPDLSKGQNLGGDAVKILRQWWRVALAAEFVGAAQSAIDFTIDYVKQRHVLGRPVGSYQAVQHRLVQCHQLMRGLYLLTLKAAASGKKIDADLAACHAQQYVQKLMVDLHQFNGAMGVTNEYSLHFWTYRMRALQSEVGGVYGAALDIADSLWGEVPTACEVESS